MQYRYGVVGRCALVFLFAAWAATSWADALTDRAKRLLDQKKSQEAYDLLLPQEGARAGDPDFDFLLGIAAFESREYERSVFAFERVLAVRPNDTLARAWIAQAYFAMGELDTAKREFETVQKQQQQQQQVPAEARERVDSYLSAIKSAESNKVNGFIELGGGWDTNVNSATSNNQVAVPAIGGPLVLTLVGQNSTQRADSFGRLAAGVDFTRKLSSEWSIVGGAAGAGKLNRNATEFDTMTLDGSLGVKWSKDSESILFGVQAQDFELDWARYRETAGLITQWTHNVDSSNFVSLWGQYAALRYPTQDIRDANRKILGLSYTGLFAGDFAPLLVASTYFGREDELADGVPNLGHKPVGVRFTTEVRLAAGWTAFVNGSYEYRKYGGPEPVFGETRVDKQADLGAGIGYVIRPGTTLIGQIAHTENRSNIDLFQFHRTVYTAAIRFNF